MKRIYIAIMFIVLSVFAATFELIMINKATDSATAKLERIEKLVGEEKVEKAEKLCKKLADEYDENNKSVLYCFYRHDVLEEISDKLYGLEDYLDDERIEDFHEISHSVKKKLLIQKEKEHITIQNIL